MNKSVGISFVILLAMASFVFASNELSISGLKAVKHGELVTVYGNIHGGNDKDIINVYCMHNDTRYLIGSENYSLSNSANGKIYHFYIRSNVPCIKTDSSWIQINSYHSENVNITKKSHHNSIEQIITQPIIIPPKKCKNIRLHITAH